MEHRARAVAHSNIALAKYWGKRDVKINLPAVGSISLTLSELRTETEVRFSTSADEDRVWEGDREADPAFTGRVSRFLDLIRKRANTDRKAHVRTTNNFPTGAGLASSASGFAALTLASCHALGLKLKPTELSALARQGSGSAARSIFGGFVEWRRGELPDGSDSNAVPIAGREHWDLRMAIAVTSEQKKAASSTAGMELTRQHSPYYSAWVERSESTLHAMRDAIATRDFTRVGELSEASALAMHAVMISCNLLYWNPATVALLHAVAEFRRSGLECYATIDAGPQVKVLCQPSELSTLASKLQDVPGVLRVLRAAPGPDARVESMAR